MIDITDHLEQIRARVTQACIDAGREPRDISLIAVSKRQDATAIEAAYAAGLRDFGESFVTEAHDKLAQLKHLSITWHFIGRIQSNKTRRIASHFDWVHSVDNARVAQRLSDQRPQDAEPLQVLVQVNIAGESQKGGIEPQQLSSLAEKIVNMPNIVFRGLMTIAPAHSSRTALEAIYDRLGELLAELRSAGIADESSDTLSMGMSADFEVAIASGATMIRIGTALFGPREITAN